METDIFFRHWYLLHIVYSLVYVLHSVFRYSVCVMCTVLIGHTFYDGLTAIQALQD